MGIYGVEDSDVFSGFFGRKEICTPVDEINPGNVVKVLTNAIAVHAINKQQIDYLYRYMRGQQPILRRTKTIRPEINNKIVENHASEICQFTSGYFLGEPVTYVQRGDREASSADIELLNSYMYFEDKASHDKDLATWMAICGVGYRMVLPDASAIDIPDESPFELDTPDPRYTFIVYSSGFGHKRMMGVREVVRAKDNDDTVRETVYCGYTNDAYFEVCDGVLRKWTSHALGDIPIFEYRLNMAMMGSFEPAIPLLDAINTVASNRIDGVEQFVQSLMKFKNCDIDDEDIKKVSQLGAIKIPSSLNGLESDVEILTSELNQTQTQTLVDYMYDQVLVICGLPTTKKGGASTSDTGSAVLLRDGWQQTEARARDTELLFKRTEKQFLKFVLSIINGVEQIGLSLSEVECKFTRRQHDNIQSKVQSLLGMLQAGIAPAPAIATCGLFNDPMDIVAQSAKYLEKWNPDSEPKDAPESRPNEVIEVEENGSSDEEGGADE